MDSSTHTLLVIFVGLTGVAVLMQACILLGIFLSLRKAAKSITDVTDDVKVTVIPLVHTTRNLMERISPQIVTLTGGLAELTDLLHRETKGTKVSVSEIMERVNRQTARLDSMLTVALDKVEQTTVALEQSVAVPVRHANGIVAAVKAVIDTYRTWPASKQAHTAYSYPDPDRDIIS